MTTSSFPISIFSALLPYDAAVGSHVCLPLWPIRVCAAGGRGTTLLSTYPANQLCQACTHLAGSITIFRALVVNL